MSPGITGSSLRRRGAIPVAAIRSRWARLQAWPHQLTVSQFTVVTGLIVIAVGAELLASPLCSSDSFSLWEALFTVTSAITVTGLSIIDVGQKLTPLGQVLLMALLLGLATTTGGVSVVGRFSCLEKLFTCMSALGTVGLDLGVTAQLNRWGQLALIVGMFVGRLDVLLLLSALYGNRPQPRVGYPREDVYI